MKSALNFNQPSNVTIMNSVLNLTQGIEIDMEIESQDTNYLEWSPVSSGFLY